VIQVCSRCGTRWNVRDRQRVWCPRCNGTLLAPSAPTVAAPLDQRWAPQGASADGQRPAARLPAGYRWIAVRPGSGPPPRRGRRPLGPTPRYATIPRWGLQDHVEYVGAPEAEVQAAGPSVRMVRATLLVTMIAFGLAALLHVLRYALLLVNRTVLLNPILADAATVGGVAASVLAFFALIATSIVLTSWLVARRAAAFARLELPETRSKTELWVGCLIPVVNLVLAPVFVIELAVIEARMRDMRKPIVTWWCAWVVSFVLSAFATVTAMPFYAHDVQRVADNTVTFTFAYLIALIALLLLGKVFRGFTSSPVDKPIKRWVIAAGSTAKPEAAGRVEQESAIPVESMRRDPAA
jgi:DNA-directed RNA polymerase subunit RPC12/RpoP